MSETLSASELAKALGQSRRTVSRYVTAGCPHDREGEGKRAPLRFDLAAVKAWMKETARSGDVGRPAVLVSGAAPERKAAERPTEDLDPDDEEDLVELTRRANLRIKELEVEKRERLEQEARGELVPLEDVRSAWAAQIEIVKARFRALPSLLAQRLQGRSYDEMHDAIEEELHGLLVAFSREELVG